MNKLYDVVKEVLEKYPQARNSDKALIWITLGTLGFIQDSKLNKKDFLDCPSFESITRARRKVQELHSELQSSGFVKEARRDIQDQKGTHIFREVVEEPFADRDALIDSVLNL